MPFRSNHDLVEAYQKGQYRIGAFRKAPGLASVANWWGDLGMAPGNPPPNYYASNPLEANYLDSWHGLFHGDGVSPASLYLTELMLVANSANCVGLYTLCDYLLYYPFVDLDITDEQDMDNTSRQLTRNVSGLGNQVMIVAQSPTNGGGSFVMGYTNQNGIDKQTPVNYYSSTGAGMGALLTAQPATAGNISRFVILANGDTGIRKINYVTNLVANGGLGCFVIVDPFIDITISEVNVPSEITFLSKHMEFPYIQDSAFLSFIYNTAGSIAGTIITGRLNFAWN